MKFAYSPAAEAPPIESQTYFELTMGFLPWRRFLARVFDNTLHMGLVLLVVLAIAEPALLKLPEQSPPFFIVMLLGLASLLPVSGFLNAVWISLFGMTLGKFIFGIRVREPGGQKLSFSRSVKRELLVWMGGYGFGIPLVSLFALIISFGYIETHHATWWDRKENIEVTYREDGAIQWMLWFVVILVILFRVELFGPAFR